MWDSSGGSLRKNEDSFLPFASQLPQAIQAPAWYAIRVKARHEKFTAGALRDRGYTEFLPICAVTRRWSDRVQKVELPLFPGYLFCHFEFNDRLPILKTPGVIHIVGIGNRPYPVDESEIVAIQTVVKSGLLLQPWPFLKVGQRVVIQDGPLRDVEGILADIRDQQHLIVSITMLHRSVAVRVERSWVRPAAA